MSNVLHFIQTHTRDRYYFHQACSLVLGVGFVFYYLTIVLEQRRTNADIAKLLSRQFLDTTFRTTFTVFCLALDICIRFICLLCNYKIRILKMTEEELLILDCEHYTGCLNNLQNIPYLKTYKFKIWRKCNKGA